MEQEVWKESDEFPGYLISSHGRLCRILKPQKNSQNGYMYSSINHVSGKRIFTSMHRVVAKVFIPNPENKRTVNHKNFIRDDNRVDNLEWSEYSEQNEHRYINNRAVKYYGLFEKKEDIMKEYIGGSVTKEQLAKKHNVPKHRIEMILRGVKSNKSIKKHRLSREDIYNIIGRCYIGETGATLAREYNLAKSVISYYTVKYKKTSIINHY